MVKNTVRRRQTNQSIINCELAMLAEELEALENAIMAEWAAIADEEHRFNMSSYDDDDDDFKDMFLEERDQERDEFDPVTGDHMWYPYDDGGRW